MRAGALPLGAGALRPRVALAAVLAAATLAGCASRDVYQASQGWRRSTCDGIVDAERRAACLERADRDYDAYERERAAARR